jgi:hypothetical protein
MWYYTDRIENTASNSSIIACIPCHGNMFTEPLHVNDKADYTEPLPSNDKGIFTKPLPSNDKGYTKT